MLSSHRIGKENSFLFMNGEVIQIELVMDTQFAQVVGHRDKIPQGMKPQSQACDSKCVGPVRPLQGIQLVTIERLIVSFPRHSSLRLGNKTQHFSADADCTNHLREIPEGQPPFLLHHIPGQ